MDKVEYSNMLMERIKYMRSENERGKKIYDKAQNKMNGEGMRQQKWVNPATVLNNEEYRMYMCSGKPYSDEAIKRVRIELNKVMIEIENNI